MISLRPNESYTLTWIGTDPFDTDTLYVRCVVRKITATGVTTIATVNLTDQGSHIFTKIYGVPGDVKTQLLFTYTVYSDSGYTTKSENYKEQSEHAIIEYRDGLLPQTLSGVHGGLTKKELLEALRQVFKEFPYPDIPAEYDDTDIKADLRHLLRAVNAIDIPDVPVTDLTPVLAEVKASRNTIVEDAHTQSTKLMSAVAAYWREMSTKLDTQHLETMGALQVEITYTRGMVTQVQKLLTEQGQTRGEESTAVQTRLTETVNALSERLDTLQRTVVTAVAEQGKETTSGVDTLRKYFEDQQSFVRFMQSVAGVAQEEITKPKEKREVMSL